MSLGYTISTDGLTELCQSTCDGTDQDRKRSWCVSRLLKRGKGGCVGFHPPVMTLDIMTPHPCIGCSIHTYTYTLHLHTITVVWYIKPSGWPSGWPHGSTGCASALFTVPSQPLFRYTLVCVHKYRTLFSLCRANLCSGSNTLRVFVGLVLLGLVIKCP